MRQPPIERRSPAGRRGRRQETNSSPESYITTICEPSSGCAERIIVWRFASPRSNRLSLRSYPKQLIRHLAGLARKSDATHPLDVVPAERKPTVKSTARVAWFRSISHQARSVIERYCPLYANHCEMGP